MTILYVLQALLYGLAAIFIRNLPSVGSLGGSILNSVIFIAVLLVFILMCALYAIIIFEEKYKDVKVHIYLNILTMVISIGSFFTVGKRLYNISGNFLIILPIFLALIILSFSLQKKINAFLTSANFNLIKEISKFLDFGTQMADTQFGTAMGKLDTYCIIFGGISPLLVSFSIYVYAVSVIIFLLISTKWIGIIRTELLRSPVISKKQVYHSVVSYYSFYLLSIVWGGYFPNVSIILINGLSMLLIKVMIHRMAKQIYYSK